MVNDFLGPGEHRPRTVTHMELLRSFFNGKCNLQIVENVVCGEHWWISVELLQHKRSVNVVAE